MAGKTPWLRRYRWLALAHLMACLCLLPQCRLDDTQAPREEKYVTVRLHDSLKRYDSVEIVILAAGDSNQIVGKIWNGALPNPSAVPSFHLADGENRDLSVRVRGFDSTGHLTLNMLISKNTGGQVVADLPVPVIPVDTTKPPVIVPPKDTLKPVIEIIPRLADLSVSPSALNPGFDSSRYDYRVDVAYAESTITLTAKPSQTGAVVKVAGDSLPYALPSRPFELDVGENDFTVRVILLQRETVYNLKVWRAVAPADTGKPVPGDSAMPHLSFLSVDRSALTPAFDSTHYEYSVTAVYSESTLSFTARVSSKKTYAVIGSDTLPALKASRAYPLAVGENDFTIRVLRNKLETVYTIRAWRDEPPLIIDPLKDWKYHGVVFVNLKTMGMDRQWSETGFPLLLRLTRSNFDFSQAGTTGRDLRFTKLDGTPLPYEIARWEPEKFRAEIWIHADSLRAIDDSVKYNMYWGNSDAHTGSSGSSVFGSSDGYTAVYHLAEQGNGSENEYKDASGRYHGQGGEGDGKHVPKRVEGIVDYAQDFHPVTDGVSVPVVGQILGQPYQAAIMLNPNMDPGPQTWTFETWIKRVGNATTSAIFFNKADKYTAGDSRFEFLIEGGGNSVLDVKREGSESRSNVYIGMDNAIRLVVVYTGSKYDIYVDGFLRESHNWTQGGWPKAEVTLGAKYPDGSQYGFEGLLDEVWISSQPRSPMWIRMAFESQRPGSTIVSLRR